MGEETVGGIGAREMRALRLRIVPTGFRSGSHAQFAVKCRMTLDACMPPEPGVNPCRGNSLLTIQNQRVTGFELLPLSVSHGEGNLAHLMNPCSQVDRKQDPSKVKNPTQTGAWIQCELCLVSESRPPGDVTDG